MTAPQLTFDAEAARAEADRGMSVARAGLMEWREKCEAWLTVAVVGEHFTADDLTLRFGLPTEEDGSPSNNGIGAMLNAWARSRRIRRVGYEKSRRMSSHSRVLAVWEVCST